MKLSKQERIAAIVVLVLVILVAGVFLFIKPNIETIMSTKETLASKEREYNEDVDKAATKDQLKADILAAYDKGKNTADMFFPELSSYQADYEFRAFLETCKSHVMVESIDVSAPQTASLSTSVFVPAEVEYALKEYVNQGASSEITDPRLIRQALIQTELGEAQTIGATTVSFTVAAITPEDLLLFADEVNRYQKNENGKSIRKSIELNGIAITDAMAIDEYNALAESILEEAEAAAAKVFKDKTGMNLAGADNKPSGGPVSQAPSEGEEGGTGNGNNSDKNEGAIEHYVYQMTCTITFYSIERMSDPTPILNEQDKAA